MELSLVGIIGILLLFHAVSEIVHRKEREKLIKAILAKNLTELTLNEAEEKKTPQKPHQAEFTPLEALDDDQFEKVIEKITSDAA